MKNRGPVRWAAGLEKLLVPIQNIEQHPRNPNNGDVDDIVESIKINGFNTVITVERETGYILAGNHRWAALHAMGATEAPVVYVEKGGPDGLRFMVGDNIIAKKAMLDSALLMPVLEELAAQDLGMFGTGFTEEGYQQYIMQVAEEQAAELGDGHGYGSVASAGIFQVVVEFPNEEERDEGLASITDRYGPDMVRAVDL